MLIGIVLLATAIPPEIAWVSHPATPGNTMIIQGEGMVGSRLLLDGEAVAAEQPSARSVKLTLPSSTISKKSTRDGLAQHNITACNSDGCATAFANVPEVAFFHSSSTFSGGPLRVFGRSLAFAEGECIADGPSLQDRAPLYDWEDTPRAPVPPPAGVAGRLVPVASTKTDVASASAPAPVLLSIRRASCYSLYFTVPASAPPGDYHLELQNGLGNAAAAPVAVWSEPIAESDGEGVAPTVITVSGRAKPSTAWPTRVFIADPQYQWRHTTANGTLVIRDGNISEALRAAAENGGGIVRLLPGQMRMNATSTLIPPRTKLVGVKGRSSLVWPAFLNRSQLPTGGLGFLYGADFELHNVSLFCGPGKFSTVISILQNSSSAVLDGLFVRANPYGGIGSPGGDRWPNNTDHEGKFSYDTDAALGGGIKILGNYTTISNSDIYIAGHWFVIVGQGGVNAQGTIFSRNRLSYGSGLFYYCGSSRSIIEDNLIFAAAIASQNSAFATYGEARTDMVSGLVVQIHIDRHVVR